MTSAPSPAVAAPRPGRRILDALVGAWTGPSGADLRIGLVGLLLIVLCSPGAGAHPRRDPVVEALQISWVQYGHGVALLTIISWLGVALVAFAWLRTGRRVLGGHAGTGELTTVTTLWAAALLPATPLFSRDAYSYLAQGALLQASFDPYRFGPVVNPGPLLVEVSGDWRNTTTPYGPLHLLLMRGVVTLTGQDPVLGSLALRLLMLVGFGAILWAVPRIARGIGGDAASTVWIGPMNPVVLLHLVGGAHNEALMLGFMALGVLSALRDRPLAGAALIALGAAVKATAVLALPFVVWVTLYRRGRRDATPAGVGTLVRRFTVASGGAALAAGITTLVLEFAAGSRFGWIEALGGSNKVINLLSAPTLVAHLVSFAALPFGGVAFNEVLAVTRMVSTGLMAVALVVALLWFRSTPRDALRGMLLAFMSVAVLNALALPWYYSWFLVLVGAAGLSPRAMHRIAAFSLLVTVMFAPNGATNLYSVPWLAIGGIVAWQTLRYLRKSPPDGVVRTARSGPAAPPD